MQFHAVQHDVVPHDWKTNRLAIAQQIADANPTQGDFVLLSEMTDTGWSMELDKITGIETVQWACTLAKKHSIWIQVGWADRVGERGKNCVTICSPKGERVATYTKVFTFNPLNEDAYFDSGDEIVVVDLGGMKICPLICYDLRFPELWRPAAIEGVDVFTISSSWPHARIEHWRTLLVARAIENQAFVVGANRTGVDDIARWGGSSMIVSPHGDILDQATETETRTVNAQIDARVAQEWKVKFPVLKDVHLDLIGKITVRHVTA